MGVMKREYFQKLWDTGEINVLYAIKEAEDDWRLFYRHNSRLWCYKAKEAEGELDPPFARCARDPLVVSTIAQHSSGKKLTYIRDTASACRFVVS